MKVFINKKHLDHNKGDELTVDDGLGKYWVLTGVASEIKKKESKPAKSRKTKELKTGKKTK